MQTFESQYGSGVVGGILAHEWAHFIQYPIVQGTSRELQADCVAGFTMQSLGASREDVARFATATSNNADAIWTPYGHGTSQERWGAIDRGFRFGRPWRADIPWDEQIRWLLEFACPPWQF